jgi:hypothetical protein
MFIVNLFLDLLIPSHSKPEPPDKAPAYFCFPVKSMRVCGKLQESTTGMQSFSFAMLKHCAPAGEMLHTQNITIKTIALATAQTASRQG